MVADADGAHLAQLTANMLIRTDKFPAGFGQKSRQYVLSQLGTADRTIAKAESDIPAKFWLDLSPADKDKYNNMMREARIQMTKEGFYDPKLPLGTRPPQPPGCSCAVAPRCTCGSSTRSKCW